MHHDPPVPLNVVATQDNNLGAAYRLRPALEKLTNLEELNLSSTCGDVERRSTQWEQCARVGGAGGWWLSVMFFACEV